MDDLWLAGALLTQRRHPESPLKIFLFDDTNRHTIPDWARAENIEVIVSDNPQAVAGVGSPHTGPGTIWPMALTLQALTARDDAEIAGCLTLLKSTHAGTGFMHESFDADDAARFTRPWFAWANTLFGELVVTLAQERPHLLG